MAAAQGYETSNDWTGLTSAWLTSVPIVAPSIVQAYYYDQLNDNSVTVKLPNAKGYFVWCVGWIRTIQNTPLVDLLQHPNAHAAKMKPQVQHAADAARPRPHARLRQVRACRKP